MSESFSNTNSSAYTTPAIQPAVGNTPVSSTTVAQPTQAATTVDMTNTEATPKSEETKPSHLDIGEGYSIPTSYINTNKPYFYSNQPPSTYYDNAGADVCIGASLNNPERLKGGDKERARQLGFKPLGISGYGFLGQFKTNAYYAELRATAEALSTENSIVKPTKNGFIRYLLDENGNIMPSMGIEVDKNGIEIPFTDKFPDLVPSLHVLSR